MRAHRSLRQRSLQLIVMILLCSSCLIPRKLPPAEPESPTIAPSISQAKASGNQPSPTLATPHAVTTQQGRYGELPLSFEANRGQTDPQVQFLSRGTAYTAFFTASETVLALYKNLDRKSNQTSFLQPTPSAVSSLPSSTVVRMRLLDANPEPQIVGAGQLSGKVNYLRGRDSQHWHTNIPTYRSIRYQSVYPGIDVVYYGKQHQLEYDFIVAPGVDPATIRLTFTDQNGQPVPHSLDTHGHLLLHTPAGQVQMQKPFIYQDDNGVRTEVAGDYAVQGSSVGFRIAAYDKSKPLVIDPVLLIVYSTFLGGDRRDSAFAIALDEQRNAYLAGQTLSANFPLASGGVDPIADVNNGDAFVAKLNETGTELLYTTYLGGAGADVAKAIAVDGNGSAYIAGETLAPDQLTPDFPTTVGVVQSTPGGGESDAFVAKLDATGTALLYSTFLGGAAYDRANAIALDASGNAYVAGQTLSDFFLPNTLPYTLFGPGPIAPDTPAILPHDAFVVKLNPTGTQRVYTAVFSTRGFEDATAIAVNTSGEAYVAGTTNSADFPLTQNAIQGKGGVDGSSDAFVVKLNAAGTELSYATVLGGIGEVIPNPSGEVASAIAIDSADNAVVAGTTRAPDFPTTDGALETDLRGEQDGFLAILDPDAVFTDEEERLPLYSTYLAGNNVLRVSGVEVVGSGRERLVFLGGTTNAQFPVGICAVQPLYGGGPSDAFIYKIGIDFEEPDNTGVAYSTYLGGSEKDEAYGFTIDGSLNMYIAGLTQSSSFFTTATSVQPSFAGTEDAFITKFDTLSHAPCADLRLTMTATPNPVTIGNTVTYSLAVTNRGPDIATDVTVTDMLPEGMTLLSVTPSTGACTGTAPITCSLGTLTFSQTNTITIVAQATAVGSPINRASVAASGPDFDDNNNIAAATTSVVTGNGLVISLDNETGASGQITSHPEGIACPPDCSAAFPPGTTVNLTAEPDAATSAFAQWSGACADAGTTPFCNLTVDGDLAVGARFSTATGLAGEWLELTQTCQVKGKKQQLRCRVNGTLKVLNTGPVKARKFVTRFFFSDDPTLNAGYVVLKDKKVPALNPNNEHFVNVNLRLPSGVNGSGKYIVAFVDANAQVPEGNEANNRAIFGPLP